jgi:hypothetical protein
MHEQVNEIFTCGTRCLCGPITIDVVFIQRARLSISSAAHAKVVQTTDIKLV